MATGGVLEEYIKTRRWFEPLGERGGTWRSLRIQYHRRYWRYLWRRGWFGRIKVWNLHRSCFSNLPHLVHVLYWRVSARETWTLLNCRRQNAFGQLRGDCRYLNVTPKQIEEIIIHSEPRNQYTYDYYHAGVTTKSEWEVEGPQNQWLIIHKHSNISRGLNQTSRYTNVINIIISLRDTIKLPQSNYQYRYEHLYASWWCGWGRSSTHVRVCPWRWISFREMMAFGFDSVSELA